jgi:predicted HAD superfamily Cof-like phosphohydrolase
VLHSRRALNERIYQLEFELRAAKASLLAVLEDRGSFYQDVLEFHRMWHNPPMTPRLLDPRDWALRVRLINEEWAETSTAYAFGDLEKFADGLVDMGWVVFGTAVVAGLPFDALWAEVRRANMAKRGGGIDASGKIMKPPGWQAPDVRRILEAHR